MALSPLSSTGVFRLVDSSSYAPATSQKLPTEQSQNRSGPAEERIDNAIQNARKGSLLYQVVSKLLLTEQDRERLTDTIDTMDNIEADLSNKDSQPNVDAELNATRIRYIESTTIEQGSLTFNAVVDGVSVSVSLEWLSFNLQQRIDVSQEEADPLVLDMAGDGIRFSGPDNGMLFDIDNDGVLEMVSTVVDDDVFLALDKNNNGRIDDASELFGDQTGFVNGFEALRAYDDNKDSKINSEDQIYNRLLTARLIGNQQFLQRLKEQGIESISLDYSTVNQNETGNRIVQLSEYREKLGQKTVADVMLTYQEINDKRDG